MANITASMVKDLRERTGAGMMDCKAALVETDGDIEGAIDWLRTKGLAKAAKKAGRTASEGLIGLATSGSRGALVEINSETDFVARNEQFQDLVRKVAETALDTDGAVEAVSAATLKGGSQSVEDAVKDAVATIGENMALRRSAVVSVDEGTVSSYVHSATADGLGKIGVLVGLTSSGDKDKLTAFGRQIAMHVAAANPLALSADDVDQDVIERERAIFADQARESGKPEAIIEKMVEGRIRKFLEEVVLLKQGFVMNPDLTVEKAVAEFAKELGTDVAVSGFAVLKLGEGVEKEEEDFAAEVAAAAGKA